jgi:ribonucleotide reductase beta subunit family protein with ferritin-like domain
MKKDWNKLTQHEQKVFENKAAFLIERGYVAGKTIVQLAKEIYERT